jgi:hypothetical protein
MKNRFLLFAGDRYYPDKAWRDFKGAFETVPAALTGAANVNCDWWQIVDLETMSIAEEGTRNYQ